MGSISIKCDELEGIYNTMVADFDRIQQQVNSSGFRYAKEHEDEIKALLDKMLTYITLSKNVSGMKPLDKGYPGLLYYFLMHSSLDKGTYQEVIKYYETVTNSKDIEIPTRNAECAIIEVCGEAYAELHRYSEAEDMYNLALKHVNYDMKHSGKGYSWTLSEEEIKAHNNQINHLIGDLYFKKARKSDNFQERADLYFKSLEYYERTDNRYRCFCIWNNVGYHFGEAGDMKMALKCYTKGLKIANKILSRREIEPYYSEESLISDWKTAMNNLSVTYSKLSDEKKASKITYNKEHNIYKI